MCERCADLEEQLAARDDRIAWLEGELGETLDYTMVHKIRDAFPRHVVARHGAAKFAVALYRAKGRVVSHYRLLDIIPPRAGGEDDRDDKITRVWASHLRKALGRDCISVSWGVGYAMTDAGLAKVAAILGRDAGLIQPSHSPVERAA